MALETIREVLLWCTIINFGLMIIWFIFFMLIRDWVYKIHSRFFKISEERFNTINYTAMAIYKMLVIIFNLVPFIAVSIVG